MAVFTGPVLSGQEKPAVSASSTKGVSILWRAAEQTRSLHLPAKEDLNLMVGIVGLSPDCTSLPSLQPTRLYPYLHPKKLLFKKQTVPMFIPLQPITKTAHSRILIKRNCFQWENLGFVLLV